MTTILLLHLPQNNVFMARLFCTDIKGIFYNHYVAKLYRKNLPKLNRCFWLTGKKCVLSIIINQTFS